MSTVLFPESTWHLKQTSWDDKWSDCRLPPAPSQPGLARHRDYYSMYFKQNRNKNNVCHLNIYLCSVWNCLSSTIFLSLLLKHFETWTFPSLNVKPNRWKEVGHLFNFPRLPSLTLTSGALSMFVSQLRNSHWLSGPGLQSSGEGHTPHTHKM